MMNALYRSECPLRLGAIDYRLVDEMVDPLLFPHSKQGKKGRTLVKTNGKYLGGCENLGSQWEK